MILSFEWKKCANVVWHARSTPVDHSKVSFYKKSGLAQNFDWVLWEEETHDRPNIEEPLWLFLRSRFQGFWGDLKGTKVEYGMRRMAGLWGVIFNRFEEFR